MAELTYHIVRHDGGWAYKLGDVYSETHPTHDDAMLAAREAVRRQALNGRTGDILFEDADGKWHTEFADGTHHPHPGVSDD